MAERYEVSDDGLVYTFYLKDGLKWSDGEPFGASDVVFSFYRMMLPSLGNQYATDYYPIVGAQDIHKGITSDIDSFGVTALSEKIVQFKLTRPDPLFLNRLSIAQTSQVKKSVVEAHGAIDDPTNKWIRARNFVGTGPFILEKWELNQTLEVRKNPHYWNADQIFIDKAKLAVVETESADERLYRAGQVDLTLLGRIPVEKLEYYKTEKPDEFFSYTIFGTYYYNFNTTKPPFDDINIRKAFALAVDKKVLNDRVTKNGEQQAYSYSPGTPFYSPPGMPVYSPDLAREYLAKAGFPDGKGFPTVTLIYNTMDIHKKIAVALQQMWKKTLNINVVIENQEWKVFLNNKGELNYQIARGGSVSSIVDPLDFLGSYITGHGLNYSGWSNSEYDKLIELASKETDFEKRIELMHQAESILVHELPVLPLYYYKYSNLKSPKVKNLKFNMAIYINYDGVQIEN